MVITHDEVRATGPLSYATQVRFTQRQYDLLRDVAAATDRKLGALIRDIVTVWASNHESARGRIDIGALVAELQALEKVE